MAMTKPVSFGHVEVGLTTGSGPAPGSARGDEPFRILVLGNLSGRAEPGDWSAHKPVRVDRDNLDQVLAKFNPGLRMPFPGPGPGSEPVTLRFAELEDFHPDK